jgi:regulator of ribonuclease activity A
MKTTDLCDRHSDNLQIAAPLFRDYGAVKEFHGKIYTLKVFEDNSLVRKALEQDGKGKVLVVDGGGSLRCALLGDMLGVLAVNNNWNGIIIFGCIRDSQEMAKLNIGVKALNTNPLKSVKRDQGEVNIAISFAGVTFTPDEFVYADEDGIIISATELQ